MRWERPKIFFQASLATGNVGGFFPFPSSGGGRIGKDGWEAMGRVGRDPIPGADLPSPTSKLSGARKRFVSVAGQKGDWQANFWESPDQSSKVNPKMLSVCSKLNKKLFSSGKHPNIKGRGICLMVWGKQVLELPGALSDRGFSRDSWSLPRRGPHNPTSWGGGPDSTVPAPWPSGGGVVQTTHLPSKNKPVGDVLASKEMHKKGTKNGQNASF